MAEVVLEVEDQVDTEVVEAEDRADTEAVEEEVAEGEEEGGVKQVEETKGLLITRDQ